MTLTFHLAQTQQLNAIQEGVNRNLANML